MRLVGVSGSGLVEPSEQMSLLEELGSAQGATVDDIERAWAPASNAIDEIRHKFGAQAIGPGSAVTSTHRRSPWGPRADESGPVSKGSQNPF